jgi:hypothetical protein
MWCIPTVRATFVAAMEELLELYEKDYDPRHPQVCLDEKSNCLLSQTRPGQSVQPDQLAREDHEYQRNGTVNLFVMVEPKAGYRHVIVTDRRTDQDYAQAIKWLVDQGYPDAEYINVIQDNLNTHKPASLYETFEPAEARRLLRKVRFHFTPKHASWLNMAEIEIGAFEQECLKQRSGDKAEVVKQVAAVEAPPNERSAMIKWQFTNEIARTKLQRLYPVIDPQFIMD